MNTSIKHRQARILGVILAGGRGERLGGRDKALIEHRGQPLIARVAEGLSAQTDAVVITRQADQADLSHNGQVLIDNNADQGPLAGVLVAANYGIAHGFDFVATVAVDSIQIPNDLVMRLMDVRAPHAVLVNAKRWQPTFALYDLAQMDSIIDAYKRGERAPKRSLMAAGVGEAYFDSGIFNVNTSEDLQKIGAN